MRAGTTGLVSLLFLALCPCSRIIGAEQDGLRFEVSVVRDKVVEGEPVIVRFQWTNVSDHDLTLVRWRGPNQGVATMGRSDNGELRDFAVLDVAGRQLSYKGVFACGPVGTFTFGRGDILIRAYDISRSYSLGPGTYFIRSAYLWPGETPDERFRILVHPDVTFLVLENQ